MLRFCRNSALAGDVIPPPNTWRFHVYRAMNSKRLEVAFEVSRWRGGGSLAVGGREARLQPGIQLCLAHSEHISSLFPFL